MHGNGRYEWPDGTVYVGTIATNNISGTGHYAWSDGNFYDGDVEHGLRYSLCGHRHTLERHAMLSPELIERLKVLFARADLLQAREGHVHEPQRGQLLRW